MPHHAHRSQDGYAGSTAASPCAPQHRRATTLRAPALPAVSPHPPPARSTSHSHARHAHHVHHVHPVRVHAGIETVAVYSDADRGSEHVKMATQAVHIGASPSAESYLVQERITEAMLQTGAQVRATPLRAHAERFNKAADAAARGLPRGAGQGRAGQGRAGQGRAGQGAAHSAPSQSCPHPLRSCAVACAEDAGRRAWRWRWVRGGEVACSRRRDAWL